jgi:hypothetical protein
VYIEEKKDKNKKHILCFFSTILTIELKMLYPPTFFTPSISILSGKESTYISSKMALMASVAAFRNKYEM